MNLRGLRYFLAVAKLKHFGKAADKCSVSQPSLSTQIKNLENELGIQLLERTNKKVILTEVGKEISNSTEIIFREIDVIKETAANIKNNLTGKFRLGAFPTLATYILPDLVPEIHEQLPDLQLILLEEKTDILLKKLRSGELDAALLALPIHDTQFQQEALFNDEFYLAVPDTHILSGRDAIAPNELETEKLMLLEEGHCFRDQALAICHKEGIREEQEFRATSLETLRLMVKSGTGITIMPNIARRNNETGIKYISFKNICPYRVIGLVWRKTSSRKDVITKLTSIVKNLKV